MKPVYIIGNGLFGRLASDFLTEAGIENTVIDSEEKNSGTVASGNITKPSWVSGLGEPGKQAYKDLERLYGLEKFSAEIILGKHLDLFYVARPKILNKEHITGKVTAVGDGWLELNGEYKDGYILVAAGVWTEQLVDMPTIDNVTGVSFVFDKEEHKPQFSIWAPYKQSISYQYEDKVWFGDGTAIRNKNWQEEKRVADSLRRASEHGLTNPAETNIGYRPYVKGHKDGYFEQVADNTWVSTGGGKNGIVLAAIQAQKFLEAIQRI